MEDETGTRLETGEDGEEGRGRLILVGGERVGVSSEVQRIFEGEINGDPGKLAVVGSSSDEEVLMF